MIQYTIKLDDDDNQAFAAIIATAVIDRSAGPTTPDEIFERCRRAIFEMLDHPWLDTDIELRNEVVKSAARTLGIKIIV